MLKVTIELLPANNELSEDELDAYHWIAVCTDENVSYYKRELQFYFRDKSLLATVATLLYLKSKLYAKDHYFYYRITLR